MKMETNPSAFHLTAIAMLAQSDKHTTLSIPNGTLEDIVEAVKLFGGHVYVTPSEYHPNQIYSQSRIGNSTLWIHHYTSYLACILQREYFQSNESIFENGTDLEIIDNQYLILSDATK
jgi:hypothetical protein